MNNYADLALRAYNNNRYAFTHFLSLAEFSDLESERTLFPGVKYLAFGGYPDAERVMVRFGNYDELQYDEKFPIVCIRIKFANKKFAVSCNHRDYLGALMGLGLERKCFGDIICDEAGAYVFVHENNADYVLSELTSVGRNVVTVAVVDGIPEDVIKGSTKEILVQAASMRVDGIAAHVFHLSRKDIIPYFFDKKVAVNGRITENNDKQIAEGDLVSVRGFGKFRVSEVCGLSKKGKQNLRIDVYQ